MILLLYWLTRRSADRSTILNAPATRRSSDYISNTAPCRRSDQSHLRHLAGQHEPVYLAPRRPSLYRYRQLADHPKAQQYFQTRRLADLTFLLSPWCFANPRVSRSSDSPTTPSTQSLPRPFATCCARRHGVLSHHIPAPRQKLTSLTTALSSHLRFSIFGSCFMQHAINTRAAACPSPYRKTPRLSVLWPQSGATFLEFKDNVRSPPSLLMR